jgi:TRAP-type C4-dicarboxylate transport system permease small subunit
MRGGGLWARRPVERGRLLRTGLFYRTYRVVEVISDWSDRLASAMGIALVAVMTFVVILQVIFRYIVKAALPWPEELARYLMVWCAFVGASSALRVGEHVGVTFIVDKLPKPLGRLVRLLIKVAMFYFMLILIKHSWRIAQLGWRSKSGAMLMPMFYPRVGVTVGSVLMQIQLLDLIFKDLAALFGINLVADVQEVVGS